MTECLEGWQFGMLRRAGGEPRPPAAVGHRDLLRAVIAIGTRQTERRDRAHHQPGVDLTKSAVVNSEFSQLYGRVVVDEKIGPGDEAGQ